MKYLSLVLITFSLFGCKNETKEEVLSANEIVNKSIEDFGGKIFDRNAVIIKFDFRDIHYKSSYTSETKVLSRRMIKDDIIIDFLNGNTFQRYINKKPIKLEDSMAVKYSASVNSVHYFSTLPLGLNDNAVNKILLGEEQIKDKGYYKIKVNFNQEGGGEDYEDVFMYWIDKEIFKVDYLAYSYNEDDGKGMRFREADNERYVNGLRFVDYNNFKPENDSIQLFKLGKAFENNQLKLLSKIELENVTVDLIDL
ncbi:DUF6503 family protein [Winogradskyella sp. PG-2]|uniref:DUF6503 family protein n=1 Tax=Winogradskyella sp. PG-2 TaxID=754409 RepID=UPI0004587B2F|nr:DUF6503 family protein [Winogradskyella sp. PG-2]BAO77712.1 hypothetical protein WPG_3482 [Winogradskyella sp. PG-2]